MRDWELYGDEPDKITSHARNALTEYEKDFTEFTFTGKIFISHGSRDHSWCLRDIVDPLHHEYDRNVCVYLNRYSHDNQFIKHLNTIEIAAKVVKTFIVVVSTRSLHSKWMPLESRWAIEQAHPIIICSLDETDPSFLREEYASHRRPEHAHLPIEVIDLREKDATQNLLTMIKRPEFVTDPVYYDVSGSPFTLEFKEWRTQ
jgi:hypothetical protein